MIFTWTFIGEKVWVTIPYTSNGFYLLTPFTSLKYVFAYYGVLGFLSFVFWAAGTALLNLSIFCEKTAPMLYSFTTFLVVSYWIGFFIIGSYLIHMKWGQDIKDALLSTVAGPSLQEAQEKIFRREFKKFDYQGKGRIHKDDLPTFFVDVGVFVNNEDMPQVLDELQADGDGNINLYILLGWYKEYNIKNDGDAVANNIDEEDNVPPNKPSSGSGSAKSMKDTTPVENMEDEEDEENDGKEEKAD